VSTVKEKGRKPDRKSYHLPYGLRNPCRNLRSENSQDYTQKPQRNWMFMNWTSSHMSLEAEFVECVMWNKKSMLN
jgi:hypothetical protein